jgi:hypothetical protein
LICAVTIAGIALHDLTEGSDLSDEVHAAQLRRTEAVRRTSAVLRKLGGSDGGSAGVREPREPRPLGPSMGTSAPLDPGLD